MIAFVVLAWLGIGNFLSYRYGRDYDLFEDLVEDLLGDDLHEE